MFVAIDNIFGGYIQIHRVYVGPTVATQVQDPLAVLLLNNNQL